MRVGSLFSGIGGLELGLERAGMEVVWQVEKDDFCRNVLAKHWPDVRRYEDVRGVGAENLESVDLICGGFPCQDISVAGRGAGLEGERSGLWHEYARIVRELRPEYVLVENVPALTFRGLGVVLGDLAALGYDAEWECISAAAVGAPHIRDRVWILAYPGCEHRGVYDGGGARARCGYLPAEAGARSATLGRKDWQLAPMVPGVRAGVATDWWKSQSSVDRAADGIPGQLDRNRALGNAVVPQVSEWIGRRILTQWEAPR